MKKTLCLLFIFLFLVVCAVPGIAYVLGYEAQNFENRPLAREAELSSRGAFNLSFPEDFDDWWGDHFGLREEMVTAFHALTMGTLRDTLNQKVVVGKGNWLFYSETMNDYLDINRLSDEQIAKIASILRLEQEYCESRGMNFVFMAAPNKNTVYPEYMPARYAPTGEAGNRERLYVALAGAGVQTIDLASLLVSHKSDGALYYEQDTHWNARGARIAYVAIMESLASGAAYDDYAGIAAQELVGYRGDLHNFVLPAAGGRLPYVDYGLEEEKAYDVDEGVNTARDMNFGTSSGTNAFCLLFFRDSFGEALIPFVSNNIGRVVYSQESPYNYVFSGESFDVVAIELVERNIPNLLIYAPLMPALERALPEGARQVEATVESREKSGYTQLYGCYDGAYGGAVYVEVTFADGVVRAYEAFPVLDAQAADAAAAMDFPQGYFLTLPVDAGEWTSIHVFAVSK
ncbi:MAG TPA: hypothetical protein VN540_01445 [Clostridia bacterium]|nr:hypothetical protein [Clostridia bacterium]